MKLCTCCNLNKDESEFWKNQGRCKECRRAYDKARYQTHYKKKRRESVDDWCRRQRTLVFEIKAQTPCADCQSIYHPVVMDFDHLPEFTKTGNISNMIGHVSDARLRDEIAKCELVCSNCHRLRSLARGTSPV